MEELISEILEDLIAELEDSGNFNKAALAAKVKAAAREIRRDRNYPDFYSEEMVVKDLSNYYSNIHDLAMYDYNQSGAEGQTSHNENGTSRAWKPRSDCKLGVIAICKSM